MKFKNIKKILIGQIENNVNALWTYDKDKMEFTMIFENYANELKIYTPKQLLDKLKQQYERKNDKPCNIYNLQHYFSCYNADYFW